jgi:hypothetical protein
VHAHIQGLVSVLKMVTMLEECTAKEKHFVVQFVLAEGLKAKDIHKEMFPLCGGKCFLHEAVHIWDNKFSHGCSKVADDEMEV